MARLQKSGLEYFPLNVDMDQDDKIALIEASHGIVGFGIVVRLLMKIYKEGYYYEWTEREQLLFSKRVNVDINTVNVIINDCLKWGLFNKYLYDTHHILTSKGIQRRYFAALTRRKKIEVFEDFILIDLTEFKNVNIISLNVDNDTNSTTQNVDNDTLSAGQNVDTGTQRKVKKRKVKKSKVKNKKIYVGPSDQPEEEVVEKVPFDEIKNLFNELCPSYSKVISITEKRKPHIRARWEQFEGNIQTFETAFTKLEESEFCKGNNDRRWKASFDWLIANDTNLVKVLEGKYDNKTPAKIEPKQWGILRELYADAEREEREIDKNRSD
jgi:hypothetical protein